MKFWGKADRIFLALIAGTVALKVMISRPETAPSDWAVTSPLASALASRGLSVTRGADPPDGDVLVASGRSCRMWARDYLPYGTALTDYRSQAVGFGPLMFAYRGQIHDSPPKLRPLLQFFVGRELARVGLKASRAPIIAVAASKNCDLKAIPWERVAEVAW